jgi:hypothetical protein
MGVQPPSDDGEEPAAIEFGIAALDAKLPEDEIEYPASARDIDERVGHIEVPYDPAGHAITVSDALEMVSATEFDMQQDLPYALHPVFELNLEETASSLLALLRPLVPV